MYEDLTKLDPASVRGLPAGLVARAATCELLADMKRDAELEPAAVGLYLDLNGGRWKLARATYRFYAQLVSGWLSTAVRDGLSRSHRSSSSCLPRSGAVACLSPTG